VEAVLNTILQHLHRLAAGDIHRGAILDETEQRLISDQPAFCQMSAWNKEF
jgi:hypothetical protein